jgi:anti-sigma factor RsiW
MTERLDLGQAMREALPVYEAPTSLEAWAREEARKTDTAPPSHTEPRGRASRVLSPLSRWRFAAGLVIAAAAGWAGGTLRSPDRISPATSETANALVDTHVRSMLPGHLMDVQSSDRHTVKPWFAGKIDIAPAVVDLAEKGFPLLGGRLDYVDGHTAAALVYGRRQHTINLFVWRSAGVELPSGSSLVRGYSLLHWTSGGLSYWAVTDASPSDLEGFREAYVGSGS